MIAGWDITCEIAYRWMSLDFTDDKSALVQVMAWCCQATSHYPSQCWPRPMSPYGITRPEWVEYAIFKWLLSWTFSVLLPLCAMSGAGPGGGTPYVMGDTYVPRFWPPFFTLAGSSTIFLGYFFSSTNSKAIFWGTKTTNFYKNRSFWPQIQFFPRSFWVQFSAASGTPPSVFRPSTPPGVQDLTDDSSALVQVMAGCRQATIKWDVSIHVLGRDLYLLKPTLGLPKRFWHLTRAEEVVITRLQIGHTKSTKSHSLSWGPPAACQHCGQTVLYGKLFTPNQKAYTI